MEMITVQVRDWNPRWGRRSLAGALLLVLPLLSVTSAAPAAQARRFTVLHRFTGKGDGKYPGPVIRDSKGNLYGTTSDGGSFNYGIAFKIDPQGKETVLHSFWGGDGVGPSAALIRTRPGVFNGTTDSGGTRKGGECVHGCGTVFTLDSSGRLTVLYAFTGSTDGGKLTAELIQDTEGTLYGVTQDGGNFSYCQIGATSQVPPITPPIPMYYLGGCGVVFKVDKNGKETVLHTFTWSDGAFPGGGLVRDDAGSLYGVTLAGGKYGHGTVFKLDSSGIETVLYSFSGSVQQFLPHGTLVLDAAGNLYGVTQGGIGGCGVVYKLDATGKQSILHTFTGLPDGCGPSGGLLRDQAGNLYGTTDSGGTKCTINDLGCGTIFRIDAKGKETVLYRFKQVRFATGGLVMDTSGNLYGTTYEGGDLSCGQRYGCGTVFKLTP